MNDATEDPNKRNIFNLLHVPGRKDNLGDVHDHLKTASRLARASWNALSNRESDPSDERDRESLIELASLVADHTSVAEAALYKKSIAGKSREPCDAEQ
jgi:hypothetical protein